jgi:sodium-dependent dicarboxylate transporter 2/3/5
MESRTHAEHGASKVRWGGLLLGPVIAAAVYMLLPASETIDGAVSAGLSEAGRATGAIGALMAVWWLTEALPLAATALLPIVLFPLTGALGLSETTARYAHPLIFLFMGGFLLALGMQRWGLHKRIALTTILLVGTRPKRLIAGFMIATALLSMFVSNTATAVMLVPIAMSVVELARGRLGDDREGLLPPFACALMLSIAYAASIGGIGTLIGSPPNTLMAGFVSDRYAVEISFARWMLVGVPLVLVFLPIAWLYLVRFASPVNLPEIPGGRALIRDELRSLGPMSRGEWTVFIVFVITAGAWITRPLIVALGEWWGWSPLTQLSDTGIAMAGGLALFIIPVDVRTRTFALDWSSAERLPWGVLLLFGGGLALARAMEHGGVDVFLGSGFGALSGAPVVLLVLSVALLVIFLTELTSNTAVTSALLPVLAGVGLELGIEHPVLLLLPATLAASCAFMLPVATPPNAIVFASGAISVGRMARAGLALNLIGVVLVTLASLALYPLLGWSSGP